MLVTALEWVNAHIPRIGKRDPKQEIRLTRRAWNEIIGTLLLVCVGLTVMTTFTLVNADENHAALCSVRGDLAHRVQASKDYLRTHPHGAPGIPVAAIVVGLKSQQATVKALSSLSC